MLVESRGMAVNCGLEGKMGFFIGFFCDGDGEEAAGGGAIGGGCFV